MTTEKTKKVILVILAAIVLLFFLPAFLSLIIIGILLFLKFIK